MENAIRKAKILSGTVEFKQPINQGSAPLSFALQTTILNGDALTHWEFDHLYQPVDMVHVDGEKLKQPQDYFSRLAWCPIDKLTLKVTLPPGCDLEAPTGSMFRLEDSVDPADVVEKATMHFDPVRGSKWLPPGQAWKRVSDPGTLSSLRFSSAAQTWELSVVKPPVGTCYSLDWTLPDGPSDARFEQLAKSSKDLRTELLNYRNWKRDRFRREPRFEAVGNLLEELHQELLKRQRELVSDEAFEIGFMTFCDHSNRLEHIGGTGPDGKVVQPIDSFWLPFGLGLAGACYKMGDRAYVYYREEEAERTGGPQYYLPLTGQIPHTSMIAFPIDNAGWDTSFSGARFERSRQCIGVIDVSVKGRSPWFDAIKALERDEITRLHQMVLQYGERISSVLTIPKQKAPGSRRTSSKKSVVGSGR